MKGLGAYLAGEGITLRSGAADGADTAFEEGCDLKQGAKEIFLPWRNFNEHDSQYWRIGLAAYEMAALHHPAWNKLPQSHRKLISRNTYQIMGKTLDEPALFVVCWTPGGKITDGTGFGITLANYYEIPVFNFGNTPLEELQEKILDILSSSS